MVEGLQATAISNDNIRALSRYVFDADEKLALAPVYRDVHHHRGAFFGAIILAGHLARRRLRVTARG